MEKMTLDITKMAFGDRKTKKISLNLDEETLDFIDEIAELTKSPRTAVILGSLTGGLEPFLKSLETAWNGLLVAGNLDEEKKKKVKILMDGVQSLRKKLLGRNELK